MSRHEFFKRMRKEVDSAFEVWDETVEGISTGSLAINRILGNVGGFPRGKISEVSGWESSGKTTLCISACAQAQRVGLYASYLDPERGLDLGYATRLHFDFTDENKGAYMAPRSFEDTMVLLEGLIDEVKSDIIVVDSVPALVPQDEIEGSISDGSPIAIRARMLSAALPKLAKKVAQTKIALVFVNQVRMKVETGWTPNRGRPTETTPGGSALRFYASLRLQLKQLKKDNTVKKEMDPVSGKEIERPIQARQHATAVKNKVSDPYQQTEFYIRFDKDNDIYGIDNLQTIIDAAIAQEIIDKKSGGHMAYKSDTHNFRVQGEYSLYLHLLNNPDVTTEIREALKAKGLF